MVAGVGHHDAAVGGDGDAGRVSELPHPLAGQAKGKGRSAVRAGCPDVLEVVGAVVAGRGTNRYDAAVGGDGDVVEA